MRIAAQIVTGLTIVGYMFLPGYSIYGFSSFQNAGGDVHAQIIREALKGTVSDTNLEFVIKACDSQNASGSEGATDARRHFQDGTFSSALGYLDRERKKALNYSGDADTDPASRAQALRHFGLMLHTAQDFYSGTNYLEMQLESPKNQNDPYNIELVDWVRVPDGYSGASSGMALSCGTSQKVVSSETAGAKSLVSGVDLNKDNSATAEGKKAVHGITYFDLARQLAVRETQRQWNIFEALIRGRFHTRATAIIAALKNERPAEGSSPEEPPELD